jgi:hypothetical protein
MAEYILGRIKFVYQGNWTTATPYKVDDVVTVNGKTYICLVNHTSSSLFATDLLDVTPKWNIVADGQKWRGAWTTSTRYELGDQVLYGAVVYTCNTAHTSASFSNLGLENDQGKWDIFATSFNWLGAWTQTTYYKLNDVVSYGGYVYICITPHESASTSSGLENDSAKWSTFNAGITYLGAWSGSSVRYKVNDIVKYGADLWICTVPHTSSGTTINTSDFSVFVNGFESSSSWSNSTNYVIGDLVTYGGNTYVAIQNHSNQDPSTSSGYWNLFTTGFTFIGDWNNSTGYLIGDVIRLGGYTYVATADNTNQTPPNASFWQRLNSGLRWNPVAQSFTAVSGTNISSSGTGAKFDVTVSKTTYAVVINTSNTGSGYASNDTIKILGTSVGGVSPANDITITVTGVSSGNITTVTSTGISVTWQTGTTYVLGDITFFGVSSYICVTAHVASSGNRPDADTAGTYWNIFASGTEQAVMTTQGDMFYYGANGAQRLPIGLDGQVLRVSNNTPTWNYYGQINNVVYVSPDGTDTLLNGQGTTIDKPWNTILYATYQIEQGYLNTSAKYLIDTNKQFLIKEVNNYVLNQYTFPISAASSTVFTTTSTVNMYIGMPIVFSGTLGGVTAGQVYYVLTIPGGATTFSISATYGGLQVSLTPGSGSMTGTYSYSQSKTERDAGLVVDGVSFDISHNGNYKSTNNALSFYQGYVLTNPAFNSTQTSLTTGVQTYDLPPFIASLTYLQTLLGNVLANTSPATNYQLLNYPTIATTGTSATGGTATITFSTQATIPFAVGSYIKVSGVTPSGYNGQYLVTASTTSSVSYTSAATGSQTGAGTVQTLKATQNINTSYTAESGTATKATSLVGIITDALKAGTTANIPAVQNPNTTISVKTGTYNEFLPIVVPAYTAVVGDELRSSVVQPAAARPYLLTDKPKSIAALQRIQTIVPTIMANSTVSVSSGNTQTQVTTLPAGDIGSTTAVNSVVNNTALIINMITNGLPATPAFSLPTVTGYNTTFLATYGNAVTQINNNYLFIKAEIAAYLNTFYSSVWTTFGGTNQTESLRDIGFVLDGLVYDMTYGGNTASLINGSSYWSLNQNQILTAYQAATVASLGRLKTIITQIVQGQSVTPSSGNTVLQSTGGSTGNSGTGTFAQARVQDVIDWLNNGVANATIAPTAAIALLDAQTQNSYNAVASKITEIASDTQVWVTKWYQAYNISTTLTNRDAGLVATALSYDLAFGSNYNSIAAGRAFNRLNTSALSLLANNNNELNATLGSLAFLGQKTKQIAAGGSSVQVQTTIDDIVNIINGQVTTTLTTATTGTNILTVSSTTGMSVNMPITFNSLPSNITTTATATSSSGNTITLASVTGVATGQQIYFTGTVFGNIVPSQLYYVKTLVSSTITVSLTFGGAAVTLVTATGTMNVTINNAGGIWPGNTYWINSIASGTTLTITNSFKSGSAYTITNTVSGMTAGVTAGISNSTGFSSSYQITNGTLSYNDTLTTIQGAEILRANRDFIANEALYYIQNAYGGTVTTTTATSDQFALASAHNFIVNDPIIFSGTTYSGSGITIGTVYYVKSVPSTTAFTVSATLGGTTIDVTADGSGSSLIVRYYEVSAKVIRDAQLYVDSLYYDLKFTGNYKSMRAVELYLSAQGGSQTKNMFQVRNSTGIRNMTLTGLTGTLTAANSYGTKRPTAGAYSSLDPGFGPNDQNSWIYSRSCYTQNCTMFGTGCVGGKVDGSLHAGGYHSMVANDYTTILSDGIGYWVTGSSALTELVSVFCYYSYSGYLAELGGRIRATNGNSSYGTYGVVAEGTDTFETPLYGTLNNRYFGAQITNTVTDGTNNVLRLEFENAGSGYTNSTTTVSGSGVAPTVVQDEFRDATVFETRIIDPNNSGTSGGTSYVSVANAGQSNQSLSVGTVGQMVIAATDTALTNAYNGMRIQLTAGTGVGQYANILTYVNGSKVAQVYKDSFTNLTVTATTNGSPSYLTVASTTTLYANMPFFLGTAVGGLTAATVYYVKTVINSTTFSVATSSGGTALTSAITTTTGQSVTLYAAGWDHVVPGTTIVNALDLTTSYIIEPLINYTAPGYLATARTMSATATWQAAAYGAGSFVAVASGSTAGSYSTTGKTWTATGALTASTNWQDVVYAGGQGAVATAVVGGLGGTGAVLTAVLGTGTSTGQVVSVTIVNGGYNYTTPPTIQFSGGGGAGAAATCTVLNGAIQAVTITVNGAGYSTAPTVSVATSVVSSITANTWGFNYFTTPTVTLSAPFSATAWSNGGTATLNNYYSYYNNITLITNYYQATVGGTFSSTPPSHTSGSATNGTATLTYVGTLATATAVMANNGVSGYTIVQNGFGYTSTPTVTITDSASAFWAISGNANNSAYIAPTALGGTWSAGGSTGKTDLKSLAYGNGTYVAVGGTSGTPSAAQTTNPTSAWIDRSGSLTALSAGYYSAITYGNGYFIAVNNGGNVTTTSSNGVTWTAGGTLGFTTAVSIAYGNGRFVVLGSDGSISYSINRGTSWTTAAAGLTGTGISTWSTVRYGQGLFYAIATSTQTCATSPDGINWTTQLMPSSSNWKALAFGNPSSATLGPQPIWVAVSATSGTIGASMRTGATSLGRVKVVSGVVTEIRMVEPGSGYPKGNVSATTISTNLITVDDTSLLSTAATNNQPIEFNISSGNLQANTTYYVIGSSVTSTQFQVTATAGSTTPVTLASTSPTGMIYTAGPVATITDPNHVTAALIRVRTGYGALANPSFSNRGSGNATATSSTVGDGYADIYQNSAYINVANLFAIPQAGANVQFGTIYQGIPWTANTVVKAGIQLIGTSTITSGGVTTYYYNVYSVTVGGTTGSSVPTFTSGSASDGTATLTYVGTNPNIWYKLVAIVNVLGVAGNYTAQFQVNPALTTYNAPVHGTSLTTKLKYSQVRLTGHDYLYIGSGNFTQTNYPYVTDANAIQANQQFQTAGGRVFFTSTDQDGNFNVGNLFGVQQATGTATLNASAFNLAGLQSLTLGAVTLGIGSATITQFSTDPYFTANSDNILPTQKAIKSFITAQIGGGSSTLNVNTITAGQIYIANNTISNTAGGSILVTSKMNFTGGIDGAPVALVFFGQH